MRKIVFTALAVAAVLALNGCGSSSKTVYQEEAIAEPETPITDGNVLIVSGNEGNTGISYQDLGDGNLLIDCGDGGCGDISVGTELTEDGSDDNDTK